MTKKMMSWKYKFLIAGICLGIPFVSIWMFDSLMLILKNTVFLEILLIASIYDLRTRIIPDWIHVLLLLVGCIDPNLSKALVGLIITPLPFLIVAMKKEGSIGGGDIKLIGACGFVYGMMDGLGANIMGLACSIVYYEVVGRRSKGELVGKKFPLVPFIAFGYLIWSWVK